MHLIKNLLRLKVSCLFLWVIILAGCDNQIVVSDETINIKSEPLLEFSPDYGYAPVWLTENEIFLPSGNVPNFQGGAIYDLVTNEFRALLSEFKLDCFRGEFHDWSRLPNGKLGFLYECRDEDLLLVGDFLIAWDNQTNQYEILKEYVRGSFPGGSAEFAVAHEFDEVLQEANGGGVGHQLYHVSLEEDEIIQLFPDFYRASSPSWSPDGQQFVFAGNESAPSLLDSIFAGYQNLQNEIYKPWNLYIADRNGDNFQEVFSGVRFVDTVKWSPQDQDIIAFRGEYNEKLGLWLFNLDSKSLLFLWPEGDSRKLRFDWSPDGIQIVLLDCKNNNVDAISISCRPIIVTTPSTGDSSSQ